jgi:hypothetical protein
MVGGIVIDPATQPFAGSIARAKGYSRKQNPISPTLKIRQKANKVACVLGKARHHL